MDIPFVNLGNNTHTVIAPISVQFAAKNGKYLGISRWYFTVGRAADDDLRITRDILKRNRG
jgi:hypothetical protein